jgi:excisionase family DNA binding protein
MSQLRSKENQTYNINGHLLNIDEAAERLNISAHTVRALVRQRKITLVRLGTRILFRPEDLEDFIKSNLVQPLRGEDDKS